MVARAVGLLPLRSTRWCVMISGRGSNLAALIETSAVEIRLVVTTDIEAGGVAKARRGGLPVLEVGRKIDWPKLDRELRARQIDAIFLLGFMRIVPAEFITLWEGRILNLHPSLLPAFPGLRSIERAAQANADCGATVHEVVVEVDAGRVLSQRVSRPADDRLKALASIETLVHIDEQRLVKEIVELWRPKTRA